MRKTYPVNATKLNATCQTDFLKPTDICFDFKRLKVCHVEAHHGTLVYDGAPIELDARMLNYLDLWFLWDSEGVH